MFIVVFLSKVLLFIGFFSIFMMALMFIILMGSLILDLFTLNYFKFSDKLTKILDNF